MSDSAGGSEGGLVGGPKTPQQIAAQRRLQQTQAQVDEVVDIMRTNVEKVLERDQKLSELDDRADALQQGASQFEQQAGKLKRKFWLKNLKMMIIMGVIGLIIIIIIGADIYSTRWLFQREVEENIWKIPVIGFDTENSSSSSVTNSNETGIGILSNVLGNHSHEIGEAASLIGDNSSLSPDSVIKSSSEVGEESHEEDEGDGLDATGSTIRAEDEGGQVTTELDSDDGQGDDGSKDKGDDAQEEADEDNLEGGEGQDNNGGGGNSSDAGQVVLDNPVQSAKFMKRGHTVLDPAVRVMSPDN